jgi:CBS domain-containing protein
VEYVGRAKRVRIYIKEGEKVGMKPAHIAVLDLLRLENAQGATVLRGIEGFGAAGEIHVSHFVGVGQQLPLVIEWIDRAEIVDTLLPRVKALIPHGLMTVDETEIALYQPHPVRELSPALTAADVMSRQVATAAKDTPLREVVELMLGKTYRAVPVVDEGIPVGIITNSDLVRRGGLDVRVELLESLEQPEAHSLLERLSSGGKVAADVMTPGPVAVDATASLRRVAEIMTHRRLKRLPVVDDHGTLVGMVSRLDLLRTAAGGFERGEPEVREIGLAGNAPLSRVMRRDIPSVHRDTPLAGVLQAVMSTRLNRALVVDSEGHPVGVVTDAEILDRLTPSLRPGALRSLMNRLPFTHPSAEERETEHHARAQKAEDLMVPNVATAREDTSLSAAIAVMLRGSQKVLAVTDATGRVVGIVDRADLLHGLVQHRTEG